MSIEIRPVHLPDRLDGDDGAELTAFADLIRRLDAETLGTTDLSRRPRELLHDLQQSEYTARTAFGAFDGGRIVGFAEAHWELDHEGQPTNRIIASRRRAEFVTPIPKPRQRMATTAKALLCQRPRRAYRKWWSMQGQILQPYQRTVTPTPPPPLTIAGPMARDASVPAR